MCVYDLCSHFTLVEVEHEFEEPMQLVLLSNALLTDCPQKGHELDLLISPILFYSAVRHVDYHNVET